MQTTYHSGQNQMYRVSTSKRNVIQNKLFSFIITISATSVHYNGFDIKIFAALSFITKNVY